MKTPFSPMYLIAAVAISSIATFFLTKQFYISSIASPVPTAETAICADYNNTAPSTLEIQLIRNMTQQYRNSQLDAINKATGLNDAYSIWFSLESLKEFSYHIENEFNQNNQTNSTIADLGVRFYYSSYPDRTQWTKFPDLIDFGNDPATSNYGKLHTLIMVPTLDKDGYNYDFNPSDVATYVNGIDVNAASTGSIISMGSSNVNKKTNSKNHGNMCPPSPPNGLAF